MENKQVTASYLAEYFNKFVCNGYGDMVVKIKDGNYIHENELSVNYLKKEVEIQEYIFNNPVSCRIEKFKDSILQLVNDFYNDEIKDIEISKDGLSKVEKGFLITCIMYAASEYFCCFPRFNEKYNSQSGIKYSSLCRSDIFDLVRKLGGDEDDLEELCCYF